MSYKVRPLIAIWCMFGLICATFPAAQISLAQETVVVSDTNVSVSTGGTWQHDSLASSSASDIDLLVFTSNNAQFIVISGTTDIARSFSLLEVTHPIIDIELTERYALRGVDADGVQFVIFQVAIGNGVQTLIAPASTFGAQLTDAQAHIQVNGITVMSGVNGPGVAAVAAITTGNGDAATDASAAPLLAGASEESVDLTSEEIDAETDDVAVTASPEMDDSVVSESPETEETAATASPETDESATDASATPIPDETSEEPVDLTSDEADAETDAAAVPESPKPEETATPTVGDATDNDSTVAPGPKTGFVNANTFVSPQFGHTVTWTDDWSPATDKNGEPTFVNRVDGSSPYDEVCLTSTGKTYVCAYIRAQREDESFFFGPNPSTQETHSLGLPYFAIVTTDIAGSRGYFDLTGNATVREERLEGNILIRTHISARLEILPDQVAAAQAGIQIDGVAAFSLQDEENLRQDVEIVSATIPSFQAERDHILADLGLVNEHHFVSNAMACDVAWSSEHELEVAPLQPIRTRVGFDFVADAKVSEETFHLVATEESPFSFQVICYQSITSPESIYDWRQTESTIVEGNRVLYRVDEASSSTDANSEIQFGIIVKPASGPAVEVRVSATKEGLETPEPGILIINGVDIFEATTEDAFISKLP